MSKMVELIKELAENHNKISMLLPGIGPVSVKVESINDDLVIVVRDDNLKVVMHYTQFTMESH
jgi:hypothetical protein